MSNRVLICSHLRKTQAVLPQSCNYFLISLTNFLLCLSSRFIQEIEHAMGLGPAKQCPLREFLTVYIKNIFLNQVLAEINKEIEGVTKTSDPLKILANADTMKVLGVQRPLLQVMIHQNLLFLSALFIDLPTVIN